jgi:hypothetical protein
MVNTTHNVIPDNAYWFKTEISGYGVKWKSYQLATIVRHAHLGMRLRVENVVYKYTKNPRMR